MADVFISYSKADRWRVEVLAAALEAEGWSVWYDKSLTAGDDFRDVIMAELTKARAVVVLWTDVSVKSDWVRSEAGRGHAERKLIPVKLAHLAYKDLPPPFDVLHTENLDNTAGIRAAIVAQLAKPAETPSTLWLATRELRYQALTWFGIIGGALTLFSGLSSLLVLADWARFVVTHWQAWTHGFWATVFGSVGLKIEREWVPIVTTSAMLLSVAIGQRLSSGTSYSAEYVQFSLNRKIIYPALVIFVLLWPRSLLHFMLFFISWLTIVMALFGPNVVRP